MPLPALVAPLVASLFSAGLNTLGNAVLAKGKDYVEEKLNVNLDEMVSTDEGKIKLAEIELNKQDILQKFILEKREQELREDKMSYENTDSARRMQMAALSQGDIFSKRFAYYFGAIWSLAAMVYIGFITFGYIPPENTRFADTILGFVLGTVVATIINFFFGSSNGSKTKEAALTEAVRGVSNGK